MMGAREIANWVNSVLTQKGNNLSIADSITSNCERTDLGSKLENLLFGRPILTVSPHNLHYIETRNINFEELGNNKED
jgi:hypothetical protein